MSRSSELRRRYTVVLDLWRAPGEDIENFEGTENPDTVDLVDEARFNLETASRVSEAVYWLTQRGWNAHGAYDALVLNRSGLTREELAKHLVLAGLQKQVVEEYDDPDAHRPSRLVHLDPESLDVQVARKTEPRTRSDHCPLCLKGESNPGSAGADSVLQEAEMILAAARFKDAVRRAGLSLQRCWPFSSATLSSGS